MRLASPHSTPQIRCSPAITQRHELTSVLLRRHERTALWYATINLRCQECRGQEEWFHSALSEPDCLSISWTTSSPNLFGYHNSFRRRCTYAWSTWQIAFLFRNWIRHLCEKTFPPISTTLPLHALGLILRSSYNTYERSR